MTAARVSAQRVEALTQLKPNARTSAQRVEALTQLAPPADVSAQRVEVLYSLVTEVTLTGSIPRPTSSFSITIGAATVSSVTLDGTIAPPTGAFNVVIEDVANNVTLAGQVPAVTGTFDLERTGAMTLVGVIPAVTGTFTARAEPDSIWSAQVRATSGLIYWARLNDGAVPKVLTDGSGNAHHGSYYKDGATLSNPVVGEGHGIDWGGRAAGDAVGVGRATVPDDTLWIDTSAGLTVSFWVNLDSTLNGQQQWLKKQGLFAFQALQSQNPRGNMFFVVTASNGTGLSPTPWPLEAGRHFLMINDDGLTMRVYVDGDLFSSVSHALHPPYPIAADTTAPILYSSSPTFSGDPIGDMDEVTIWSRSLSPTEVHDLYVAGLAADVTLDGQVPAPTGSFSAYVVPQITLTGQVPAPTGSFSLSEPRDVTLDGTVPGPTAAFTITKSDRVTLTGTVPAVLGDFRVAAGELRLAGVQQNVQGSFLLLTPRVLSLAGTITRPVSTFAVVARYDLSFAGEVTVVGDFLLDVPSQTDTGNTAGGRLRNGTAIGFYDPPVTPPPGTPSPLVYFKALAYAGVTVDTSQGAARAHLTGAQIAERKQHRLRILIGGVDVTYWRGIPTPRPTWSYIEPLLYGPGGLTLPQVVLPFEVPGEGALKFLDKGARVRIQRVDPDTNQVLAPDLWRGLITKHNLNGRAFSVELAGEAAGRAALVDKPVPIFRRGNDLGYWAYAGIRDLGLPFMPYGGPDTGLTSLNWGGTNYLDYLGEVCARAVARSGTQWTIMPGAGGHYRFREKDTDTRTATIYLDDSLAIASLTSDLAEEPNQVYASGVTTAGERVRFGVYPGLIQSPPAPYPFDSGRTFGPGTTNADTDSGDGVTVMLWKLVQTGYLDMDDRTGDYDLEVSRAIARLKDDADITPRNGIMNQATWAALFDLDVTGYTLAWSHIEPAAQWRKTRKYRRSASGGIMGLNPFYDPTVPIVSTTIDVGTGWKSRGQIQDFADGELTPQDVKNWVGTITLNGRGIILGSHDPGDPLPDNAIVSTDLVQTGWNVWLPLFDGGTLMHVSAVSFDSAGNATLTVDTRARDSRKVWEVIRRNRDSRINPARSWLQQHRSSGVAKDAVTEFDEVGGRISDGVKIGDHKWAVFPVIAGQQGSIRELLLQTKPFVEYAVAVFGKEVTADHMTNLVGNPLTKTGTKQLNSVRVQKALDDDLLLYFAGDHDNPLGYWPRPKVIQDTTDGGLTGSDDPDGGDDTETDPPDSNPGDPEPTPVRHNPLTGKWRDNAGFDYRTFQAPVLWVAIFARHATTLQPGRIMSPQLDAGT